MNETIQSIILILMFTWMGTGCIFSLIHRKMLAKTINGSFKGYVKIIAIIYVVPIMMYAIIASPIYKLHNLVKR